jgi:exoribonuclease-2
VEKGTLIEYRIHAERRLAVAERPDGKKNWIVIDELGQSQSIRPQQVSYEIARDGYKQSDLANFRQEVEPYLDPDSLEVAWEILVEDAEAVSPAEMALLLFSDQTPAQCYAAYCLLSQDKLFF